MPLWIYMAWGTSWPQWHLPPWREENEQAFVHCGKWKSNKGLDNIANGPALHVHSTCNKVTNDMFPSVAEDQIIWQSVFEISIASVYKGPLILLSPLWHIPPWPRVSYATVILSGIISLWYFEYCIVCNNWPLCCGVWCKWKIIAKKKKKPVQTTTSFSSLPFCHGN